jgi:hypothetical protein
LAGRDFEPHVSFSDFHEAPKLVPYRAGALSRHTTNAEHPVRSMRSKLFIRHSLRSTNHAMRSIAHNHVIVIVIMIGMRMDQSSSPSGSHDYYHDHDQR